MVRLSKQKQEKLEHIMSLVEHLGIDRVLVKLRQTKMMSKDALDDMKEWETDYEKRVALLGFLVSHEGKQAFGALYELAKVREEQLKLQEEQEKLRQEQMMQQGDQKRTSGGKVQPNMKHKMRAQMAKRRTPQPVQPQKAVNGKSLATTSQASQEQAAPIALQVTAVSKKIAPAELPPPVKTPVASLKKIKTEEKLKLKPEPEKRAENDSSITETNEDVQEHVSTSQKSTTTSTSDVTITEPEYIHQNADEPGASKESKEYFVSSPKTRNTTIHAKALDDYACAKTNRQNSSSGNSDGQWGSNFHDSHDETKDVIEIERLPPEGENADDVEASINQESESRITSAVKSKKDKEPEHVENLEIESPLKNKLNEIYHSLSKGEVTIDQLTVDDIKDIINDWQTMRKESQKEKEAFNKEILHAKEELRKALEEKDKIRKEKDKYVFKEFELQQKYQDLSQKHRTLREDHEILKQGNHQNQQSTKKTNKLSQDLKKKVARLENKLKSMDKLTAKKSTQTQEIYEKDVYEAKRVAEESLSVVQSELKEATSRMKTLQQENEELKKQINAKGREINKRERKSRKDEENLKVVSRERESLESKLKKVMEQLEYYRGMMDIRTKGTKRPPEKKEVRVQRCSSGRHILVKTSNSSSNHHHHEECPAEEARKVTANNQVNAKPARPGAATVRGQPNKKPYVVPSSSINEKSQHKSENVSNGHIQGILKPSNTKPKVNSDVKKPDSNQQKSGDNVNTTSKKTSGSMSVLDSSDNRVKTSNSSTALVNSASPINSSRTSNGTHKTSNVEHQPLLNGTAEKQDPRPVTKPRPVVMASSIKKH